MAGITFPPNAIPSTHTTTMGPFHTTQHGFTTILFMIEMISPPPVSRHLLLVAFSPDSRFCLVLMLCQRGRSVWTGRT
jgi:hypothetical protein